MVSKTDGSANIISVATSRISRSLLGSSATSRSTIPMLGKSTYWDDARSVALSIGDAPTAVEDSGAVDVVASSPPCRGWY
jgi:hypothetical protein